MIIKKIRTPVYKSLVGKDVKATWLDHYLSTSEKFSDLMIGKPKTFVNKGTYIGCNEIYYFIQMAGDPDNVNDSNNDHYALLRTATKLEKIGGKKDATKKQKAKKGNGNRRARSGSTLQKEQKSQEDDESSVKRICKR